MMHREAYMSFVDDPGFILSSTAAVKTVGGPIHPNVGSAASPNFLIKVPVVI